MEEDDVRFRELLARFLGDADIDVLMEGGIDEANIVVADDLDKFLSCVCEFFSGALAALEPNLYSIVIFVELDLGLAEVGGLLDLLEEVLAVQPHHLHGVEVHAHLPRLLLRHEI
jgi:hypothetical protein